MINQSNSTSPLPLLPLSPLCHLSSALIIPLSPYIVPLSPLCHLSSSLVSLVPLWSFTQTRLHTALLHSPPAPPCVGVHEPSVLYGGRGPGWLGGGNIRQHPGTSSAAWQIPSGSPVNGDRPNQICTFFQRICEFFSDAITHIALFGG